MTKGSLAATWTCLAAILLTQAAFAQPSGSASELTFTPTIVEKPEVRLLDTEGQGKLYQVGKHLICIMEGTPEEMGFQHGRLLAARMAHGTKRALQKALWDKGYTREYVRAQVERMQRFIPAEYVVEMKAIVKGLQAAHVSDISYEDIRLVVTQGELLHYPPGAGPRGGKDGSARPFFWGDKPRSPAASAPQCSNFACWGRWTPDGRLLHGRNLDWRITEDIQDSAVVLVWRPKQRVPYMMVTWAGGVGGVSGMNAQGITIGEMTSPSSSATYDGMPLCILMRRVLEKSSDLATAVRVIEESPRTLGWNFVIGDGKVPDARALDTDAASCDVFTAMDERENVPNFHAALPDAVRRANHPVRLQRMLMLIKAIGPGLGLKIDSVAQLQAVLPLLKMQNSYQRYDWLGKQIEGRPKGIDVPQALQLLSNGPVLQQNTLHSWVFDPKNQAAYVAVAGNHPPLTASRCPYTCIQLREWFR
jgi:hypothetical protein